MIPPGAEPTSVGFAHASVTFPLLLGSFVATLRLDGTAGAPYTTVEGLKPVESESTPGAFEL